MDTDQRLNASRNSSVVTASKLTTPRSRPAQPYLHRHLPPPSTFSTLMIDEVPNGGAPASELVPGERGVERDREQPSRVGGENGATNAPCGSTRAGWTLWIGRPVTATSAHLLLIVRSGLYALLWGKRGRFDEDRNHRRRKHRPDAQGYAGER